MMADKSDRERALPQGLPLQRKDMAMNQNDKPRVDDQRKPGSDDAQDPGAVPENLFSQYGLSDPGVQPGPGAEPDDKPASDEAEDGTAPVR